MKRMVSLKSGKGVKTLILALSSIIMRYNGYAYLMTNLLVTCQIIFYPNITYIY